MLSAVSAVIAAVPSLRTTCPNPINVVLLPEAAQVNSCPLPHHLLVGILLSLICSQVCGWWSGVEVDLPLNRRP